MTSRASSSMPWMKVDLRRRSTGRPSAYMPGRLDHAAIVHELALLVQHRHVQPAVVRDGSRSPRRSLRIAPLRRSSCSGEAAGTRVGSKRSGAPTSASRPVARAHSSKVVEQALHLQVGEREDVAQAAREQRPAVADGGEPADQRDAHRGERVEIERGPLGGADQLRRRQATGARQVVDLVVALVPDAGGVHPPQHVAAAIRARQAHVLADRQRHRTARTGGSRRRAGRRSPTRRRRARRRRAGDPGCRSRTA